MAAVSASRLASSTHSVTARHPGSSHGRMMAERTLPRRPATALTTRARRAGTSGTTTVTRSAADCPPRISTNSLKMSGLGDDADQAPVLDDRQRADLVVDHASGGFFHRVVGRDGDSGGYHNLRHAVLAGLDRWRWGGGQELLEHAAGDNAHDVSFGVEHRQPSDTGRLAQPESCAGVAVRAHADRVGGHDVTDEHRRTPLPHPAGGEAHRSALGVSSVHSRAFRLLEERRRAHRSGTRPALGSGGRAPRGETYVSAAVRRI